MQNDNLRIWCFWITLNKIEFNHIMTQKHTFKPCFVTWIAIRERTYHGQNQNKFWQYLLDFKPKLPTVLLMCLLHCLGGISHLSNIRPTVYPKKYAHGFCFAVLCCGYTLTVLPISIRLTSLALGQSNDCPSASKATLMNMDKYFMWIHYERLHNHNKAKHNKTVCIFLGIYCSGACRLWHSQ